MEDNTKVEDPFGMEEDWSSEKDSGGSDDNDSDADVVQADSSSDEESDDDFSLHNAAENGDLNTLEDILRKCLMEPAFLRQCEDEAKEYTDEEERNQFIAKAALVQQRKSLERRDHEGCTPLHVAILARQAKVASFLIEKGARTKNKCNNAPLVHLILGVACIKAHVPFAEEMLGIALRQPDILEDACTITDELGRTSLHLTAEFRLPGCAKLLLETVKPEPTSLLSTDNTTRTAFHVACSVKSLDMMNILLDYYNGKEMVLQGDRFGTTPLHVCAEFDYLEGFQRILEVDASTKDIKDKRNRTSFDIATIHGSASILKAVYKNGDVQPNHLNTLIMAHEICTKHYTCPPKWTSKRGFYNVPPENVNRLHVLLNEDLGILHSSRFSDQLQWQQPKRANLADILRVHDYGYIEKLQTYCNALAEESDLGELDGDTTISKFSFEAAMFAAGSVCDAIDSVCAGSHRNAFCAVRPPGHHAGPRGVVTCANDPNGSFGFCLLSNAAIGAAYARHVYRHAGVRKVAIIDFDVHHGNGTEACVKNVVPNQVRDSFRATFCNFSVTSTSYKPWLNEEDWENVFFASIHGYGKRVPGLDPDPKTPPYGMFYPSDGPNFGFGTYQKSQNGEPIIVDVGQNSSSRDEWRAGWRCNVLPQLDAFKPDLILISAGFDAHRLDDINMGYISAVENDYYWLTQQLVMIANRHCNGRIVSILEGGYKIQGRVISPFARSVYSHVAALVETSPHVKFDSETCAWENDFETQLRNAEDDLKRTAEALETADANAKRPRRSTNPVDYVALNAEMNAQLKQKKTSDE